MPDDRIDRRTSRSDVDMGGPEPRLEAVQRRGPVVGVARGRSVSEDVHWRVVAHPGCDRHIARFEVDVSTQCRLKQGVQRSVTIERPESARPPNMPGMGSRSANLGASTLVDLVLKRDTEFTHSPVVNRRSKDWEPEPIRWTGIQSMYRLFRTADAREEPTRKTSLIARFAKALTGMD